MSLYLLLSSLSLSLLLSLSRLLDLSLSLLRDLFSLFTLSSPILMDIHKILWKNPNLKTLLASVAKYKLCFPAFLWLGRWGPEPTRAAIGAALADWNSSKWRKFQIKYTTTWSNKPFYQLVNSEFGNLSLSISILSFHSLSQMIK